MNQSQMVIPKPRGLLNLGNTCYANTTYQCLTHCIPLSLFFLKGTFEKHIAQNAKTEEAVNDIVKDGKHRSQKSTGTPSMMCMKSYFLFLQEMCMKDESQAFNPKELFAVLGKAAHCKYKHSESTNVFTLGQQHDMAEYLQHILDLIHDTIHFQMKINIQGKIEGRMDQMLTESYKQFAIHCEKQYSFVSDMMTGQYFIQIQTCDNKHPTEHSEKYDPFTLLTLPIPLGRKTCSLYDCLDIMVQPEIIEGWKGELTSNERMIERRTYLWRLPQILIIQLKRFMNRFVKNEACVNIATELDLTDYCLSHDNKNAKYHLFAIGNHEGTLQFGHYYADCKNSNGQWHRFNDASVSKLDQQQLNGQTAYILFYYRAPPNE